MHVFNRRTFFSLIYFKNKVKNLKQNEFTYATLDSC